MAVPPEWRVVALAVLLEWRVAELAALLGWPAVALAVLLEWLAVELAALPAWVAVVQGWEWTMTAVCWVEKVVALGPMVAIHTEGSVALSRT